jgi:ectoine hydroxylase-related dioxygenase (phytanoyl-CoA dioxygenase family)
MSLEKHGFEILRSSLPVMKLDELRDDLFQDDNAGERSLLDGRAVRETALYLKQDLIASGHLSPDAVAIQAIAFNKTDATNWKVAWHQDVMFPFAERVRSPGFAVPTVKQGIDYARPPAGILEQLLAVRLHLDDCHETNGPLRISPATHLLGILETATIFSVVTTHGEVSCLAQKGEILLMRPLALHASSQATAPKHRRVLHFFYHSGAPIAETWHRAI